jgi:hypothetical protein
MNYPKNRKSSPRKGCGLGTPKSKSARACHQCQTVFMGKAGAKHCSLKCRLDANSRQEGECIVWAGYARPEGYGEVDFNGERHLSNRAAWMAYKNEDPGELCVCHKCDNPRCINPEHLFLGTRAENSADRDRKGRQARGERNGPAKLTEEQVRAIRADERGCRKLAKAYGVHMGTILSIRAKRTWRHVA